MSRTTRRPDYLLTQGCSPWSKRDAFFLEYDKLIKTGNGHGGYMSVRPMTKAERASAMKFMYGESRSRNARSPGRGHREWREQEMRSHNKAEIIRWLKNPEYEPIVWSNPMSCLWDWS